MTHTLLNAPAIYKPMKYEWAFQAWKTQQVKEFIQYIADR